MNEAYEHGGYPDHNDSDEIMLLHETEQDYDQPVMPTEPIPVIVRDAVVTVDIVAQHTSCYSIVLTAGSPIAEVLGNDPLRISATIWSLDHDIVLCHSEAQANDPKNQVSGLAAPNGAIVTNAGGFPPAFLINSTQQFFLVGNTFPSRVSVMAHRRSA
jgi:hypothetical protein